MKKQEIVGSAYPCWQNAPYFNENGLIITDIAEFENNNEIFCACGKNCKPIKVKVTVEEV